MHDLNLSIDEISKVEGNAGLEVKVTDGNVESVRFRVGEYKRFFTQAVRGKNILAVPQSVARICGTCSNAHLLCSIEAVEDALSIKPSPQTKLLRKLTMYGLIIRDHALHLYCFSLPDVLGKDSILDFDANDAFEHELLDDTFAVKSVGNNLSVAVAGRSVHGPYLTVGGFLKIPLQKEIDQCVFELTGIRPKILKLIDIFLDCPFEVKRDNTFVALVSPDFDFLEGVIKDSNGRIIKEEDFRDHLEHTVLPYSEASGYTFELGNYMVGALARLNLNMEALHPDTKRDAVSALRVFPSKNIYHNNLAQAIEILHAIDASLAILSNNKFDKEDVLKEEMVLSPDLIYGTGMGVIEAPRGTLYHEYFLNSDGTVAHANIVVPTGQNQISIEDDVRIMLQNNLDKDRDWLKLEAEKIIRAYDPCLSCASHFLTLDWKET